MNTDITVIIILFQECASFYLSSSADVPRTQGSQFCCVVAMFHDLVHPTFANLWQSCHILALLSISFSVFLFLFYHLPSVVSLLDPFLHPFSSTCLNHRNLCSLRNSSNLSTFVISRIFSLSILFCKVFSHIIRNILNSVVFNFFLSSTFNAQHSAP